MSSPAPRKPHVTELGAATTPVIQAEPNDCPLQYSTDTREDAMADLVNFISPADAALQADEEIGCWIAAADAGLEASGRGSIDGSESDTYPECHLASRATERASRSRRSSASYSAPRIVRPSRNHSAAHNRLRSPPRFGRSSRSFGDPHTHLRAPQGHRKDHSDHHTRDRATSPHSRRSRERERPLPQLPVDFTQSYWMVQQANSLFAIGASPRDTLATLLKCANESSAAAQDYQRTPSRVRYDAVMDRVQTTRAAALAAWNPWTTAVHLLASVRPRADLIYYLPDIRSHVEFYSGQRFFTVQRREDYLPARDVLCIFDGPALVGAYNLATRELAVSHNYVEAALDQHFSYTAAQQFATAAAAPGFVSAHSRDSRH